MRLLSILSVSSLTLCAACGSEVEYHAPQPFAFFVEETMAGRTEFSFDAPKITCARHPEYLHVGELTFGDSEATSTSIRDGSFSCTLT